MELRHAVQIVLGCGVLGFVAACGAAQAAGKGDLVVAAGGKTNAIVVVAPGADNKSAERQAADDLARCIELMSGARPAVAATPEAIAAALKSDAPVLLVGRQALEAKPALQDRLARVAKKDPVLRADAIVLLREANRVYLAGTNDESHYYAVAELLRRWGCRWFIATEFGECIPEQPTLTLGDLDYAYAPPFEVRTFWISWNGDYTGHGEFKRRNMMTDRSVGVPCGHALSAYVKELVPQGKSAFNIAISDERTAQHVAAKVEDKFAKGDYFSLGMDDGMYESDSPKDKELLSLQWDKYFMLPCGTDAFMQLYNNVCRILLAKHPGSKSRIGFLAYSNMTIPPARPTKAEKPLVAYLAPIDIDPIHGMDDADSPPRQEYKQMLYGWAKVMDGRVAIYDYDQGMLVWRDIPNPSIQSFRQDVRHYLKAGILGLETESRNAIATTFINLYLRGRLMWNPDEDVEALLADFYPKFYGPTAGPMSEYWNTIFKAWNETIVTEHEYFLAPAIYTPGLVAFLRGKLEAAEKLVAPLAGKQNPTRNEKLYVERIRFTRMSFDILDGYMAMVKAAATECDYAAAVATGERVLAIRERLTDTNGIFTTYRRYPEQGPAWWPGEVQQYRELLEFTSGAKGTLLAKLPLEWAFRRDPQDVGLAQGYAAKPVDLSYWDANKDKLTPADRKDYPDQWEALRTDLYIQAQGIRYPDRQGFTGYAWYRTEVQMTAQAKAGALHIRFPGLFNDCWLYVNGQEVAHRNMKNPIWWLNDYKFEWDVDLSGKLQEGKNTLALRLYNPHHFGGMFRRPFLYTAK